MCAVASQSPPRVLESPRTPPPRRRAVAVGLYEQRLQVLKATVHRPDRAPVPGAYDYLKSVQDADDDALDYDVDDAGLEIGGDAYDEQADAETQATALAILGPDNLAPRRRPLPSPMPTQARRRSRYFPDVREHRRRVVLLVVAFPPTILRACWRPASTWVARAASLSASCPRNLRIEGGSTPSLDCADAPARTGRRSSVLPRGQMCRRSPRASRRRRPDVIRTSGTIERRAASRGALHGGRCRWRRRRRGPRTTGHAMCLRYLRSSSSISSSIKPTQGGARMASGVGPPFRSRRPRPRPRPRPRSRRRPSQGPRLRGAQRCKMAVGLRHVLFNAQMLRAIISRAESRASDRACAKMPSQRAASARRRGLRVHSSRHVPCQCKSVGFGAPRVPNSARSARRVRGAAAPVLDVVVVHGERQQQTHLASRGVPTPSSPPCRRPGGEACGRRSP